MNTVQDKIFFGEALNRVHIMMRQVDIDEAVLDIYYQYLRRYELSEILTGLSLAIKKHPDFFPTAPAVESYIISRRTAKAIEVVEEVSSLLDRGLCRVRGFNPDGPVDVAVSNLDPDPIRDRALAICPPPNERSQRPFWKNRFIELYKILAERFDFEETAGWLEINQKNDLKQLNV